ncbi:MAG TPA: hypothetical protein VLG47_04285 [Candidatus Saccharimonadales bacterium]|nr:hypothetical protein [Candidatus Saccharimonadales bacterium]
MANEWCSVNCPIDCDDILTVIPDFGCESPNDDEITELFMSNSALSSGNQTEWNNRLSNSSTDSGTAIRSIDCLANLPRVDPVFKTSQKGSRLPQKADRVISFVIEDDKDSAFNYFKTLQCGAKKLFWFRSGGHIYGGLSGIEGTIISSYEINKDSENMAHNWQIQVSFRSVCFPDRVAAVI